MDGAVFPPCCLSWGQTMIEVMKIMEISFKRSHAPNPEAGRWSTPLLETAWHSLASVSQALVESMLLPPGSWCTQGLFVSSKSLFPQSCVSSGGSVVGLMATSSKRAYAIPRSTAPRAPAPAAGHCWPVSPQETLKHSSGSVSVRSLGPGAHKVCLSSSGVSGRYRVWF